MGIRPARPSNYPRRNQSQRYPSEYPTNSVREGIHQKDSPPASYTNNIKRQQLETYYKGQGEMSSVEEDHLVPLIAGGHPTAIENLWPQAYNGEYDASYKDNCEVATGRAICNGSVKLLEAQQGFKVNWIEWCKQLTGDMR
jgi:hypothetical protein